MNSRNRWLNKCEEKDAKCLANFAPAQNSPNTKSRIVPLHKMLAAKPACPPAQASEAVKPSDSEAERRIHHKRSPPKRAVH